MKHNAIEILPEHLTKETIDTYFSFAFEKENNVRKLIFPKHEMPWDVYMYAEECAYKDGNNDTNHMNYIVIKIYATAPIPNDYTDDKDETTGEKYLIHDDLLNLINWCIKNDISFISFADTEGAIDDGNVNDYIIPDLPLYQEIE